MLQNDHIEPQLKVRNIFDIIHNGIKYSIQIGITDNENKLYLGFYDNELSCPLRSHQIYFSINDLYKIDNLFKSYDNIAGLYVLLKGELENKKVKIIPKDTLAFTFYLPNGNTKEINFKLNDYLLNQNEINNRLINECLLLRNEVTELKNKNSNLTNKLNYVNKILLSQFMKSKIISTPEIEFIYNCLETIGKIKNIKLLYRHTLDRNNFFKKCAKKGATLTIVQTNKNRVFCGFTKAEWTNQKGSYFGKDKDAFLLSLDKFKMYPVCEPEKAILSRNVDLGTYIYFGNKKPGDGIKIAICGKEQSYEYQLNSKIYDGFTDVHELTGEENFTYCEIEMYQIEFTQ